MIRYNKLFTLLKAKNMKKTDLLKVISSPTLAKLSKNEVIKTDTIDKLCLFLEVQPDDIMECLIEKKIPINGNTYTMLLPVDYEHPRPRELDFIQGDSLYILDENGNDVTDLLEQEDNNNKNINDN